MIRIGHLSTGYHTALCAIELKALELSGLNPAWSLFGTGPPIVKALEAGELDLGYIGLPPVIIGAARGAKIRCVAGGHMDGTVLIAGGDFISAEEAGAIQPALAQLAGKKIGAPSKGSIHDVILRHLLAAHGLADKVAIHNYPWTDLVGQAMEKGEIAAAVGTPSLQASLSMVSGMNIKSIINPSLLWPNNPSYGIIAMEEFMRRRPEELMEFLRIHESLTGFIKTRPGEAARRSARLVGMAPPEFFEACYKISPRYCAALPEAYIGSTMSFVQTLRSLGYINRAVEREEIFDLSFITKIHPGSSHYDDPSGFIGGGYPWLL